MITTCLQAAVTPTAHEQKDDGILQIPEAKAAPLSHSEGGGWQRLPWELGDKVEDR